jgi:uncharacterized membrane protein YkvA (DUF1232 family)
VENEVSVKQERGLGSFLKNNWYSIFVLIYLISPLDFIPDEVPFIGSVDDASVLFLDLIRQYLSFKKGDVQKD